MVKRCCYGTCDTDSRYKERLQCSNNSSVEFHPFPKPATKLEKCRRWIKLCGRPHHQLNEDILRQHSKAKHFYVCSKHFKDGKPTTENPDPQPAIAFDRVTPARPPPKLRALSEPPRKRRLCLSEASDTDGCSRNQTAEYTAYPIYNVNDENDQNAINVTSFGASPLNTAECTTGTGETDTHTTRDDENRLLEMLALAAENERLKQQMAKLILDNENLLRQKTNPTENHQDNTQTMNFSVSMLRKNKKKDELVYYTGLTSEQFTSFYNFLVPLRIQTLPFKQIRNVRSLKRMPLEDQVLLVMIKLRQSFDFLHIGRLFSISQQDASGLFKNWIQYMFFRCSSVPIWPHRDDIIKMMPENFRKEFPNTIVIIDGTEMKIQRPSSATQ